MSGGCWRICSRSCSFLLPGVPSKGYELLSVAESACKKLVEFFTLAVRQRVHRVDDNGFDAAPLPVRSTWSTAGTMYARLFPDPVPVVSTYGRSPPQCEWPVPGAGAAVARGPSRCRSLDAEDATTIFMQNSFGDQFVDPLPRREGRIELPQRLRPQKPFGNFIIDRRRDALVGNTDEAPRVRRVVIDNMLMQVERIPSASNSPPSELLGVVSTCTGRLSLSRTYHLGFRRLSFPLTERSTSDSKASSSSFGVEAVAVHRMPTFRKFAVTPQFLKAFGDTRGTRRLP